MVAIVLTGAAPTPNPEQIAFHRGIWRTTMLPSSRPSQALALLGLITGQALAGCPYAEQLTTGSELSSLGQRDLPKEHKQLGKKAIGKKGVFFM